MTREEAIAYMTEWLKDEYALNDKDREVLNMAISALERWKDNVCTDCKYYDTDKCDTCELTGKNHSALEQKFCEDAVSREAVRNCFNGFVKMDKDTLPYVEDYLKTVMQRINELPYVTRQTGEWICIDDYHIGKFKCSVCQTEGFPNTTMYKPTWNFCPNCGAKMVEPQKSEVRNEI